MKEPTFAVIDGIEMDREALTELLLIDDQMVITGLKLIYGQQTSSERFTRSTVENNRVGFTSFDAKIMTSFAEWYNRSGYLSPKQLAVARKRILKYTNQIMHVASSASSTQHS